MVWMIITDDEKINEILVILRNGMKKRVEALVIKFFVYQDFVN
jgi:hypothetical protein